MKILIVDDEPLVRIGMKSIIKWEDFEYHIVGEAGDGVQALEMIGQMNPDIVLADIMMPRMDGLQLIAQAKEKGYKGKFIVLSCVSEFQYLQEALRLGVSRYVLKSTVQPDEILLSVNEVAEELKKDRVFDEKPGTSYDALNGDYALKEFLNLVFKGVITGQEDIRDKMKVFGFDSHMDTYMLVANIKEQPTQEKSDLYRIAVLGKSLIGDKQNGCSFVNFEDHIILLFQAEDISQVEELAYRLKESSRQYFNSRLALFSEKVDTGIWDLSDCYHALKQGMNAVFFGEGISHKAKIVGKVNIPLTEYSSYDKLSSTLEVIRTMLLQSKVISETEVKKIYASALEYVILLFELQVKSVLNGISDAESISELFAVVESVEELHTVTLRLLKRCYEIAESMGYKQYTDELTDKMVQYIHANYKRKISTKDVAEHIHFSVDYTCKYFKKKTQTNLTDYILKLKVFKSKQELLEGKSISEIAEEYGFSSDGHFIKTFKRYEGTTPSAFAKNY